MKKVSIIIPSYNTKPEELDECLESCFRQGFAEDDFEIILIDDGSKNPPAEIYKKWSREHSNIRFFEQENAGQSVARNRGIEAATGAYLCFVDSDDWLSDNVLRGAFDSAEANGLELAYYSGFGVNTPPHSVIKIFGGKDFLIEKGFRSGVWCYLVRTEFLKKSCIRFYLGKLCEDGVFSYEIVSAASRVAVVASDGYHYRLSENSTQRTQNVARKIQFAEGFAWAAKFFNEKLRKIDAFAEPAWRARTEGIRNYYLVFLLFRLLDSDLAGAFVSKVLSNLRREKMFPFSRENISSGRKYRILYFCLNGRLRFAFFRAILRLKFVFKIAVLLTGATSFRFRFKKSAERE